MFTLRPRRNSGGASVLNWWRPSDNEHGPVLIASVLFIFSSFAWASLFSQIWRGWLKVITNTQTSQSSHNKWVRGSISAKFGQVPETNARNVWVGCDKEWRQGIKVIFLDRQTLAWPNPSYLRIVFRSFTATNFGSFCSTVWRSERLALLIIRGFLDRIQSTAAIESKLQFYLNLQARME